MLTPPALSRNSGYFTNSLTLDITHTNVSEAIWFTLDGSDPRAATGAPSPRAQSYSGPVTLAASARVRARVTDGKNWSPPVDGTFLTWQTLTNLVVTEIYYNPTGAPGVDGEAFEFLELQNRGAFALDLGGLRFATGIDFAFTNGTTLPAGACWVLTRDPAHFAARFPGAPFHGIYTGKLSDGGETLTLVNANSNIVFTFAYQASSPWPSSANGTGDSLHRVHFGDPADPANWCAASPTPGAIAPAACRDTDADGLPDEWELAHGFDPNDSAGVNGASGDPDQDGVSNLGEFIAGTDPRNAGSYLKIDSISAGSDIALTFLALSNKTYTIQYRASLSGGSWIDLAYVEAGPSDRVVLVRDTNVGFNRFYRLVTPRR